MKTSDPARPWGEPLARQIDAACDHFEAAWRAADPSGPEPDLEEYLRLDGLGPADSEALLRELLLVEMECRERAGRSASAADYLRRFPNFPEVLNDLFGPIPATTDGSAVQTQGESVPPWRKGAAAPRTIPERLGPYRVLEELGRGAMGVVYLAEDPHLHRRIALKVVRPEALDEEARQRFLREARAAAAVLDDHVVPIYGVGEDNGVPYLAMPYLEGESLEDYLRVRAAPLPVAEAVRLGQEIARGLAAAHAKGLVHRDVKPANVWLEGPGRRAKVLDFGLARFAASDVQLTAMGAIVGTPAYMAPEQAACGPVDGRADLFSLGCVLYRLTTGKLPFVGNDMLALLLAVCEQQPVPPSSLNPEVPRALSELILSLLAKDPAGRPGSAAEVADLLERAAGAAPAPTERRDLPRLPPGRARLAAVALGLFGAVAALLAVVVLQIWSGKGEMKITADDEKLEVFVRKGVAHITDPRVKRTYTLKLVPGRDPSVPYEIKLTESPRGIKVITRKAEGQGWVAEVVPPSPSGGMPAGQVKNALEPPSAEEVKNNHFVMVNKKTGKEFRLRKVDDPRVLNEAILVPQEKGTRWWFKPWSNDGRWVFQSVGLESGVNLAYTLDTYRVFGYHSFDGRCMWKWVAVEGAFALQIIGYPDPTMKGYREPPMLHHYLAADAKGQRVLFSKKLTTACHWTLRRVPKE